MLSIILEVIFKGLGYSLILYAFWLLVGNQFYNNYIKSGIRNLKSQRRIKRLRELEQGNEKEPKNFVIVKHLELLLQSLSKSGNVNVTNFVMLSIIMFCVSSSVLFLLLDDIFITFLIGLFIGLSPYLLLRYRLRLLRLKTSLAFLNEFHIVLQSYQSTNKNIYYTLLNIVEELHDKDIKRQFRKLISSFQKERHDEEFRNHVHVFVYAINSNFAKRFGSLLIKAHLNNVDISRSLMDLSEDITNRKKDMEEEKTEKLETIMLGFAPILTFPLVIFFAYRLTGIVDFWYYFKFNSSITLFTLCLLFSVISVSLTILIRKPKADI